MDRLLPDSLPPALQVDLPEGPAPAQVQHALLQPVRDGPVRSLSDEGCPRGVEEPLPAPVLDLEMEAGIDRPPGVHQGERARPHRAVGCPLDADSYAISARGLPGQGPHGPLLTAKSLQVRFD